jgi:hypothetical protein
MAHYLPTGFLDRCGDGPAAGACGAGPASARSADASAGQPHPAFCRGVPQSNSDSALQRHQLICMIGLVLFMVTALMIVWPVDLPTQKDVCVCVCVCV